jgi:putative ABC transport system permease protein
MTDLAIVRRSMSSRLFSTVTTVITVAVAVALLLVLASMRDAGKKAFERGGGNMHMLVSADAEPMTAVLNNIFYARPPRAPLMWPQYEKIAHDYPLEFAIPLALGDSFRGFPVVATVPELFAKFQPAPATRWEFAGGRALQNDFEVVLGSVAGRSTGLKLGDQITLTHGTPGAAATGAHEHEGYRFTIVGILAPTGTSHDRAVFTTLQSSWILHAQDRIERSEGAAAGKEEEHEPGEADHDHEEDHEEHAVTAADLIPEDRKITGIYLRVITRSGSNVSADLPRVFNDLRGRPGLTVAQPKQEIDRLFAIVGNVNQILLVMAGVVMVSSGISIMVALYNSMEQRRRQIAVLRVLGASRPRIFGLILTESAILGVIGAVAGVALALAGGWLVSLVARQRLGLVLEPWPSPRWAAGVAIAAVLLAALAGIIPAVMAYRTSVARNLKPIG